MLPRFSIPRFLVRYRVPLFVLMSLLAVGCGLLVPHININTDMTRYLPDASPLKQGLDLLETELPALQEHMQDYGTVFADGMDLLPSDLSKTLILGTVLLFAVLLVMSSSFAEVLLFLVTTGFAVVLNMGTNALLPSVSMLTNTLTPVLQMVLSMDYSIILMNRYRQEKKLGKAPAEAMEGAIGGASASILSSAFTTVVSLLMLCFIKLKIGADLGLVLSKGVTASLICNFTVLPCLIIWADKAVEATRKKVPRLPAAPLARFQQRFRWPLVLLLLCVFGSLVYLQRRTPLCFSPQFNSPATAQVSDEHSLLLVYATAEEEAVPALLDSLAADSRVLRCVSYPSLLERPRTIAELKALAAGLGEEAPELPEALLNVVYYAVSHPQRNERYRFSQLQTTLDSLSSLGLMPEGFSPEQLAATLQPAPSQPLPAPQPEPVPETAPALPVIADTLTAAPADTLVAIQEQPALRYSYAQATTPLDAAGMAAFTGQEVSQARTVYRMAGRRGGTMTPLEYVAYVKQHIIGNRLYKAFIPKGSAAQLDQLQDELLAALEAGETPAPAPADSLWEQPHTELVAIELEEEPAVSAAPAEPAPSAQPPLTPQEVLLDMVLSDRKISVSQLYRALSAARIPVTQEQVDLLYLCTGARLEPQTETALSPTRLLNYVADTLLLNPAIAPMVPDSVRMQVTDAREQLLSGVGSLRGPRYSAAAVTSLYPAESAASFAFMGHAQALADSLLTQGHYWLGETPMYKELKEGFPRELLLLTLLTVLSIYLIVALTFRSLLIPIPLIMTILAGVYANVWASGLGGGNMYYLAYLIVQGILMGATIDYSILLCSYYRRARRTLPVEQALEETYKGASHSILTSGLILSVVPYVMYLSLTDPMINAILKSLAAGAAAVLLLILFVLPGVLAALDRLLIRPGRRGR